jgi:hypothetical protein
MYDNAMQAMIKKKEEEFAQLQVIMILSIFSVTFQSFRLTSLTIGFTPCRHQLLCLQF